MSRIWYKNALLYTEAFAFEFKDFAVEDGKIAEVGTAPQDAQAVDLSGKYVIPGLIDLHGHGNSGEDFSIANLDGLKKIGAYLAKNGVTSFLATSMTLPEEMLTPAYRTAAAYAEEEPENCAYLAGINMEGPYFCYSKRGAQNPDFLHKPDIEMLKRLQEASNGLLRLIDVAPEIEGAIPFIEDAKEIATVSLAHSAANYEESKAGFKAGITHMTHLFNGMNSLLHRDPGPIGAGSETCGVTAELICDGLHVHPSAVRAAFLLFGADRICIISDALAACGMPEGNHTLGGVPIQIQGGVARLMDGTIAGAITNQFRGMKNCIAFGIPAEDAIRAATANPARAIRMADEIGSIKPGCRADFVVCNVPEGNLAEMEIDSVYLAGKALA